MHVERPLLLIRRTPASPPSTIPCFPGVPLPLSTGSSLQNIEMLRALPFKKSNLWLSLLNHVSFLSPLTDYLKRQSEFIALHLNVLCFQPYSIKLLCQRRQYTNDFDVAKNQWTYFKVFIFLYLCILFSTATALVLGIPSSWWFHNTSLSKSSLFILLIPRSRYPSWNSLQKVWTYYRIFYFKQVFKKKFLGAFGMYTFSKHKSIYLMKCFIIIIWYFQENILYMLW